MAGIQHNVIPDGQRHEPKGISTALVNQVYVADGAAAGNWSKVNTQSLQGVTTTGTVYESIVLDGVGGFIRLWHHAHGSIYFFSSSAPYTWTYSATFTKIAATTVVGGNELLFTEGLDGKITYTGTEPRRAYLSAAICLKQASGSAKDISIGIAKNGTVLAESEVVVTSTSSSWENMSTFIDTPCALNDYFEVFMKNAGGAGNVDVAGFKLSCDAVV